MVRPTFMRSDCQDFTLGYDRQSCALCDHKLTFQVVPKNQKSQFDRLLVLVREDENRSELRTHMQDIKLPCIPFLGQ